MKHGPTPDCNCASHGLPESYRHGLGCPYGQEAAKREREELRKQNPPWGHKLTISIYVEGERPGGEAAIDATQAAVAALEAHAVDFAGAAIEAVQTQPTDQGAS